MSINKHFSATKKRKDKTTTAKPPDYADIQSALEETRLNRTFQKLQVFLERELQRSEESVEDDNVNGRFWKVFVNLLDEKGRDKTSKEIKAVEFALHPTFTPNTITINEPPFEIHRIGWGTFHVGVRIIWKNAKFGEHTFALEHELDFSKPKTSQSFEFGTTTLQVGNLHCNLSKKKTLARAAEILQDSDLQKIHEEVKERKTTKKNLRKAQKKHHKLVEDWERIFDFLAEIPPQRHTVALGAFLAGVYRGNLDLEYLLNLYRFASTNLRYIVLDEATLAKGWREYVTDWKTRLKDPTELERAFSLSKPLPNDERLDIFVSHCWSDDGAIKADLLQQISNDFYEQHGRLPRLWMDMFCMPQTGKAIEKNIQSLPLFLKACDTVAVLLSQTLLTRLWCLVEIYTAYILSPNHSKDVGFSLYQIEKLSSKGNLVDIRAARCGLEADQDLLFRNLRDAPGGLKSVERSVNVSLRIAGQGSLEDLDESDSDFSF